MAKKSKKVKKESPWKNIPVTPYEKTLSLSKQAKKDPVLKDALKVRKEDKKMEKLVRGSRFGSGSRVQYVPIEEKITLDAHTKDGKVEPVIVKVKTNRMKKITHIK